MAARFVKTELSSDMKSFINNVCESLVEQKASVSGFREAARDITSRFLPTTASPSVFRKIEKSVMEYMISEGYVSKEILKSGIEDQNGIEVSDVNATLPKELIDKKYGCRIDYKESTNVDEALEILLDQGFVRINAYKLRGQGVLYPNKSDFFAHADRDCSQWAKEALEDFPEFKIGKTFNVVWDHYYDIEVETESSDKVISYHQLG